MSTPEQAQAKPFRHRQGIDKLAGHRNTTGTMERVVKPLLLRSNAAHQLPFSNTCFYDDLQCKRSLDAALKGHCFYMLRTLAQPLFQARNLWEKEIALRR